MDEKTAYQVEAALIDAYPGLSNLVLGHSAELSGTDTRAMMRAFEVAPIKTDEKILFVSVNRSLSNNADITRAVRIAWPVSLERARDANYVCAVRHGVILATFVPSNWREVTAETFPEYADEIIDWDDGGDPKFGFDIESKVTDGHFVNRSLPEGHILSQSGIRYYNC